MAVPHEIAAETSRSTAKSDRHAEARNRLIVALDVPTAHAATELVSRLEGACPWLKVGLELYTAAGPAIVGGPAMLSAARNEIEKLTNPPKLLAVTVLTSMDDAQLGAIGVNGSSAAAAGRLARLGLEAGIRGFVCSPQEVAALRSITGSDSVLVVPGIRPAGAVLGDQKRVATPAEALRQGASYLVVGRPIAQAAEPAEAARQILDEMAF
jgi:orotidine-5'-phosphate decarboxylase